MEKSITARAWDQTKAENDPNFDGISDLGFKENLEYRAAKVRETGTAITNFEKAVAGLIASDYAADDSPMAVVGGSPKIDFKEAAKGQVKDGGPSSAANAESDAIAAKAAKTEAAEAKEVKATTKAGVLGKAKVPATGLDAKGKVAAVKENVTAPSHP